jgi:predicted lipoprotein
MTAEERDDYRCRLALSIVANLNRIAIEALEGWRSTWASLIREPGPDNPVYRTHKEAMTEVLKAILTGLEQMRDHRLRPALGETAEQARAGRAPYNASGQALPYLRASAEALQEFVVASGILSLVPEDKGWIENSVAFEFANLKRALDAAGPDLEAALADTGKYQKLAYAEIVLQSLHDLFQRQLAPAAGLTQGFNSLDGD